MIRELQYICVTDCYAAIRHCFCRVCNAELRCTTRVVMPADSGGETGSLDEREGSTLPGVGGPGAWLCEAGTP